MGESGVWDLQLFLLWVGKRGIEDVGFSCGGGGG